MAAKKVETSIPEHPLLRVLRSRGTEAKAFCGYIGAGDGDDDRIQLYSSLYDLSQSLEILQADVLHVEEAPSQLLPFGGSVVWVRSDATVVRRQQENLVEVRAATAAQAAEGRLRITRRQRLDFAEGCTSPCHPCHSPCGGGNCTSPCHALLPQDLSAPGRE
ncbi:hypothetical protein AB0N09_41800 [Streptomyces erythrochromogenes]|uniref:hypothetical protein n=1 Tax=Streptomyces erythrochromogenes TaxID=285574 RepID=UPI0034199A00